MLEINYLIQHDSQLKNLRRHLDHLRTMDTCVVISWSGDMIGNDCNEQWFDVCKLKERMRKYFNILQTKEPSLYSCVHISSDEVFFNILKKPSIVQE